jgi:AcrR family transcriptional regulator
METEENFRTRNARIKRAKTRARILSAAFGLFEARGIDATTIDDVRLEAGLSRGSIYNYFPTFDAMLRDMAAHMVIRLNAEQSAHFDRLESPIERICCNIRYSIGRIASDRVGAEVLLRVLPLIGPPTEAMRRHAGANIEQAQKLGLVRVPSLPIALELGYGLVTALVQRGRNEGLTAREVNAAAEMLMRAFGIDDAEAQRLSRMRLPLPPAGELRDAVLDNGVGD